MPDTPPRIPRPPSKEDLDQISRDQALITDEWAPEGVQQEARMDEQRIRERAYELWQKEGSPEGRDQEFWERARLMVEGAAEAPMVTPLSQRSAQERKTHET